MSRITLRDVRIELGGQVRLGPLSAEIGAGALTCIMGANGAGKTLLLRAVAGLQALSAGSLHLDGQPMARPGPERDVMLLSQRPILLERRVDANLEFVLALQGVEKSQREAQVEAMLARFNLFEHRAVRASKLSGGEQQKLAIARALLLKRRLLLLDEPSAALDMEATHELETILLEIAAAGIHVVVVSHSLAQVRRLADEVLFLHQGQLKEQGSIAILEKPQSEALQAFLNFSGA